MAVAYSAEAAVKAAVAFLAVRAALKEVAAAAFLEAENHPNPYKI